MVSSQFPKHPGISQKIFLDSPDHNICMLILCFQINYFWRTLSVSPFTDFLILLYIFIQQTFTFTIMVLHSW